MADTLVIECNLAVPVRAASGSVLHGLDGIPEPVDVPEDTVVHQVPVALSNGQRGVVIRVYGVEDDPKGPVAAGTATWFGRPILDTLSALGMDPETVWPGVPDSERSLWNACLFPVAPEAESWECARWLQTRGSAYSVSRWREQHRLSLASSARYADAAAIESARGRRLSASWRMSAVSLVESGADVRPLLANSPGLGPLSEAARALRDKAAALEASVPTEAASRRYVAGLFFAQAGLTEEADRCHNVAFRLIEQAVERGRQVGAPATQQSWRHQEVIVQGPARIDFGGGWSDTPPFCLDWGGTVLNMAVLLNGTCPIKTTIRRVPEPVLRCVNVEDGAPSEVQVVDIGCSSLANSYALQRDHGPTQRCEPEALSHGLAS